MFKVSAEKVKDAGYVQRHAPELHGAGGDGPVRRARGVQGAHHVGQRGAQDVKRAVSAVSDHERPQVRPHDGHYLLGVARTAQGRTRAVSGHGAILVRNALHNCAAYRDHTKVRREGAFSLFPKAGHEFVRGR